MDVLLRQHKANERERIRVLEEAEEVEQRRRKFRAALQARPTETHVRLSADFEAAKQKRAAVAEAREKEDTASSQFRAKDYNGPAGEPWSVIQERQKTERTQVRVCVCVRERERETFFCFVSFRFVSFRSFLSDKPQQGW